MSAPAGIIDARPRPYRRFLTSVFHSRFVRACLLALILAFDNVFWLSEKRGKAVNQSDNTLADASLGRWSVLSLGLTAFKAIMLFFTSLFVFVLQIATLQIGRPCSDSPAKAIRLRSLSFATVQIILWYFVSAWWFTEVYIWMSPASVDLGWLIQGDMTSPDRLNERPIYLRAVFLFLAAAQSARHVYQGSSFIHIPIETPPSGAEKDRATHPVLPISTQLQASILRIATVSPIISGAVALTAPVFYTFLFRQSLWAIHLEFAKPFFNLSRAHARAVGYPPCNPSLMYKSFWVGMLLHSTWEGTSRLLKLYFVQSPIKKDSPLSAGSKDPNGTLLNGLKAKKPVVKTFAFWELAIIAQFMPERRKAIFSDIDRAGGPRWAQILEVSLDVLRDITKRIETKNTAGNDAIQQPASAPEIQTLPRLVAGPSTKQILANSPRPSSRTQQAEQLISAGAKRLGQSPHPWSPPVKDLLDYSRKPLSLKTAAEYLPKEWLSVFQIGHIGQLFRSTPASKANVLVFGSPVANAALIVDATESITKMLIASLSEDVYGKVVSGVPESVRTFTSTINSIEKVVRGNPAKEESEVSEVTIVLAHLRSGLKELLSAFQLYLADVGLGVVELNAAKKAANLVPREEEEDNGNRRRQPAVESAPEPGPAKSSVQRDIFRAYRERQRQQAQIEEANEPAQSTEAPRIKSGLTRRGGDRGFGRPEARREMELVR